MKQLKVLMIFIFLSCNNFEHRDLTIIDNIVLGTSQKDFYRYLDSIGIEKERFFLNRTLTDYDLNSDNAITLYKTTVFNFNNYLLSDFDHLGLYYPIKLKGSDKIIGLNVFLGHVIHPSLISEKYGNISDMTTRTKIRGIYQEVNSEMMSEIVNMFNSKYGKPKEIVRQEEDQFFVLEKGEVSKYNPPVENLGEKIVWETKALKVYLYLGIASYRTVFNTKTKSYSYFFDSSKIKKPNTEDKEIGCYSFPYIHYEIKTEVLDKLGLNKPNI